MNPEPNYSPLAWEELGNAKRHAIREERARLALKLTELRRETETTYGGDTKHVRLRAFDDVATAIGLTTEVIYRA